MSGPDTETIDKLFLELSQFTSAKTFTETVDESQLAAAWDEIARLRADNAFLKAANGQLTQELAMRPER